MMETSRLVRLSVALAISGVCSYGAAAELADAIQHNQRSQALDLLKQKPDVNAKQVDGTTALHWAVRADDLPLVESLLKAGADVKAANRSGISATYLACENGSDKMLDLLLRSGADANGTFLLHEETPLMMCSRVGNLSTVKMLLDKGAKVNAKADAGEIRCGARGRRLQVEIGGLRGWRAEDGYGGNEGQGKSGHD